MKKIITLLLIVNALNIFAETVELNIADSVEKALQNDKSIKKSELSLENIKLEKKEAFKSGLPSISYKLSSSELDNNYSSFSLTAKETIFDGFKTFTAIKNTDKYLKASEYSLENTKNTVAIQVLNNYISILKLQKQLEVLSNSKVELETNYIRVKRLYELNLTTKTEVLDLNYSIIELETSTIQADNSLQIAKMNFKNTLGISKNNEIKLEEIQKLDIDINSINFDEDLKTSKLNSTNAKLAKVNTDLTRALESIEKSELFPKVDVELTYGNFGSVKGNISNALKKENQDLTATLNVTGTLFDWGKNIDAYKETKNNTVIAKYNEDATIENIELNLTTAYLEILRLDKLKQAKSKALESSNENYAYQRKRYENQLINSSDYLDAENSLRESEIALNSAELDLYYAYYNYLNLLK